MPDDKGACTSRPCRTLSVAAVVLAFPSPGGLESCMLPLPLPKANRVEGGGRTSGASQCAAAPSSLPSSSPSSVARWARYRFAIRAAVTPHHCADGASAAVPSGRDKCWNVKWRRPLAEGWDDQTRRSNGRSRPRRYGPDNSARVWRQRSYERHDSRPWHRPRVRVQAARRWVSLVCYSSRCKRRLSLGWVFQDLGSLKQCMRMPVNRPAEAELC